MLHQSSTARDGEEIQFRDAGQDWVVIWHSPDPPLPTGKPHGSAAVCFTADGMVVLITANGGGTWEFPGGRPEGQETWRATLDRELLEEACARINKAALLGFSCGECLRGHEKGLVLVRSLWFATVTLLPWEPKHETTHRRLVSVATALRLVNIPAGAGPIYDRWFQEALAHFGVKA